MIKLDVIVKILVGLLAGLVFLLFWALGGVNLGGWTIVIFLAIFLLAIAYFFIKNGISLYWVAGIIVLILVIGLFSGFIKTDLWDSKEEGKVIGQDLFIISYSEGDAKRHRGLDGVKIEGGEKPSYSRLVIYRDSYSKISFDYKGDPEAYFNVSVWELDSHPNDVYEYGAVNFSAEKEYVETHNQGGNNKKIGIIIEMFVPSGATAEIKNFKVVSA
ncbi:MAG: hypothetical protein KAQ64_02735 [Candidatus Pacebacteria bacterium]|nr:hypothetical protein [Candidatus Paceibacterota bacterium]